ncbi:MAG: hypothetical protein C4533_00035 [Candidatus Omnitrophota bacterium]|jgi:hypothetical protein|nr:MAG: hypothetical protein C4533_00035 [Candidatus Omnitrophota bacterium]
MTIYRKSIILIVIAGLFLMGQINISNASPSGEIPVRLKTGMITEAEFPEKIANVTKSVSSEILQIETLGNRIFLLPREDLDTQLYVVTQDNESFCLHLSIDEARAVSRIKVGKPRQQVNEEESSNTVNTVELMKALLSGRQPSGSVSSEPQSKEIFNNSKLRIAIDKIYEFPNNVKALCLTFENLTRKPLVVPIEHIELPGLLAVSIDTQVLEPRPHDAKKKTSTYRAKAYMVVERLNQ